jgi:hypothetical protein
MLKSNFPLFMSSNITISGTNLTYAMDVFMVWYLVKHRDDFTFYFTVFAMHKETMMDTICSSLTKLLQLLFPWTL